MTIEQALQTRSHSQCELCGASQNLRVYPIPPTSDGSVDTCVLICQVCREQIEKPETMNINHWHGLKNSMWSEVPAVQVMVWRMLNQLSAEDWSRDLLDMLFLDEKTLAWAKSANINADADTGENLKHMDSNGSVLVSGDNVIIVKDLNVKGTSFVAKRGTVVRGISLVTNNAEQIEGRVNGQQIVILTKFVKKS